MPARVRAETALATRALLAWAASAMHEKLPEAVRRRAALVLADDLGAMLAASTEAAVRTAQAALAVGAPEATVFAPGAPRAERYGAAAANGIAATWCELDEGYRNAPCHAGAYLLPALLAEAEARDVALGPMLRAVALAYEVTARCARAFPFAGMTVHPHAAFATIGAAAGAGLMRQQDGETLLGSVTAAASMSFAGPFRHAMGGALVRNAWTAAGAWIGLRCADWAQAGITGIPETLHDVFVGSFGTDCASEELTRGLGADWAVLDGYHKMFACCQYAHSAMEASLALVARGKSAGRPAPTEIVVETHPRGQTLDTVEPPTTLAAKFSLPHAMAAVALRGSGGPSAFNEASLRDPAVAALRRRVRIVAHSRIGRWPNDRPARVRWRFEDGEEWVADCESARGGADRPFDDATLLSKIEANAGAVFPAMPALLRDMVAGADAGRSWAGLVAAMVGR